MVTYIKKGKNYLPIDPTPIAEVIKIFTGYGFTVALANYNLIDSSAWMVIRWK